MNGDHPIADGGASRFLFQRYFSAGHDRTDPALREADRFWTMLGDLAPPEAPVRAPSPWTGRFAAMGMTVMAILLVGLTLWWPFTTSEQPWRTFIAGHAQRGMVMLADGSTVSLDAESQVDVRFTGSRRELRLVKGQALFEVARDSRRPFVVITHNSTVTAVGTAFNIRLDRQETAVTVVKGIVDIGIYPGGLRSQPEALARAMPREQVRFGVRTVRAQSVTYFSRTANADIDSVTSWTRGNLFFDGQPLAEAIEKVNAYASERLVLKKPALASMPVYGLLRQGDLRGLMVLVNDPGALTIKPLPQPAAPERDHAQRAANGPENFGPARESRGSLDP